MKAMNRSKHTMEKALTKIRTTSDIELLILDIMMPEMDGMQVVKGEKRIPNPHYYVDR